MVRFSSTLAAAAAALGLALHISFPAWTGLGHRMIGHAGHPDTLGNHWLLHWAGERFAAGDFPLANDRYYWPVGDWPILAGNGMEGALHALWMQLLPWPGSATALAIMTWTLNGLAAWALARAAGAGPWSSLASLVAIGTSPLLIGELSSGRFTQANVAFLLFFLATWVHFLRAPDHRKAGMAGLLLALSTFFYAYHGWFAVLAGGTLYLATKWRARPAHVATFSAAFLIPLVPWVATIARHMGDIPGTGEATWPPPMAAGQTMGLAPWILILGLASATILRRQALPWLGLGTLFFALGMGPEGALLGEGSAPYELLYGLTAPLRRFWWPGRHGILVTAALGVLLSLALHRLPGRHRKLASLGIAAMVAMTSMRAATSHVDLSASAHAGLADQPPGHLLEHPLWPGLAGSQRHLIHQIGHGRTLVTGHAMWVDRVRPAAWDAFVAQNSFLSALQALEQGHAGGDFRFTATDLATLRDDQVRFMSVNRAALPLWAKPLVARLHTVHSTLFGRPIIRTPQVSIWLVDAWDGETTHVPLEPWAWPEGTRPAGPEMPLHARRPMDPVFDLAPSTSR
jgi:hypothetical protein